MPGSLYPPDGHRAPPGRFAAKSPTIEYWAFAGLCALAWGQGAIFSGNTLAEAVRGPLYLKGVCVQTTDLLDVVRMMQEVPLHRLVAAALPLLGKDAVSVHTRGTLKAMEREKAARLLWGLRE